MLDSELSKQITGVRTWLSLKLHIRHIQYGERQGQHLLFCDLLALFGALLVSS